MYSGWGPGLGGQRQVRETIIIACTVCEVQGWGGASQWKLLSLHVQCVRPTAGGGEGASQGNYSHSFYINCLYIFGGRGGSACCGVGGVEVFNVCV